MQRQYHALLYFMVICGRNRVSKFCGIRKMLSSAKASGDLPMASGEWRVVICQLFTII